MARGGGAWLGGWYVLSPTARGGDETSPDSSRVGQPPRQLILANFLLSGVLSIANNLIGFIRVL
jgi:hypothetical protein